MSTIRLLRSTWIVWMRAFRLADEVGVDVAVALLELVKVVVGVAVAEPVDVEVVVPPESEEPMRD
jgi:hypothetical protein